MGGDREEVQQLISANTEEEMGIGRLLYLFAFVVLAIMAITETLRAGELELENKRLLETLEALEKNNQKEQ